MRNQKILITYILALIVLSGCVSKKKFVNMETLKNKYSNQANGLLKQNNNLKADLSNAEKDFEKMKRELHYNNSVRTDDIDNLQQEVKKLKENFSRAQSQLSKAKDLYKDQQYYSSQASNEITRLEFSIEQLKRDTVSLNYSLKLARNKTEDINQRLSESIDELNSKSIEIADGKKIIQEKAEQIKNEQVKIKDETARINAINAAFIELRKEMLKAVSEHTPLDPNTNINVDKISKVLGHY